MENSSKVQSHSNEQVKAKAENKVVLTWGTLLKAIAFFIPLVAIYGFSVQKGMLDAMLNGNVSANYELKEIYYYAIVGFIDPLNRTISSSWMPSWKIVLFMMTTFIIAGMVVYIILRYSKESGDNSTETAYNSDNKIRGIFLSFKKTVFVSGAFGTIVGIFSAPFTKFILVFPIGIILLPAMLGYFHGVDVVNAMTDTFEECVIPEENVSYSGKKNLCQRNSVKGNVIWGERVMDTGDAYVILKDYSFFYISKKGDNCVQEPFAHKDENGERIFSFKFSEDIEKACFTVSKVKQVN